MTFMGGKLYGMTSAGGSAGGGVIFEWDPNTNIYTKKYDLTSETGNYPRGDLVRVGNNLYGLTEKGGIHDQGTIFEWNPSTNVVLKKFDFNTPIGRYPYGSMTFKDGKFYGCTAAGGTNDMGVIFQWDPISNQYELKQSLNGTDGSFPVGNLILAGDKFYGLTSYGGINNQGTIFEWDPANNLYSKLLDLSESTGYWPQGSLTLKENKLYGMTASGGSRNGGVIFEWDLASSTYTKRIDLGSTATGSLPDGSLTLMHGKFYGMTSRGVNSLGVIFEWAPETNDFRKIKEMPLSNGIFPPSDGSYPIADLTLLLAPVAKGELGNCQEFSVTIDESNNHLWVPVTDSKGDAVAEIKANGNNLGHVDISLFINANLREDENHRLFLNRNISITPENPTITPQTTVDVRLYIRKNEYEDLLAADSQQSPSEKSINDVGLFKSSGKQCTGQLPSGLSLLSSAVEPWDVDFVFTTSLSSFSTFYFAYKTGDNSLPVSLSTFSASVGAEKTVALKWSTTSESKSRYFVIERSTDARQWENIGIVNSEGESAKLRNYYFTDSSPAIPVNYYRLKMVDIDGTYSYTKIDRVDFQYFQPEIQIYPNPVSNQISLANVNPDDIQSVEIYNSLGYKVLSEVHLSQAGLSVELLPPGVYVVHITKNNSEVTRLRVIVAR